MTTRTARLRISSPTEDSTAERCNLAPRRCDEATGATLSLDSLLYVTINCTPFHLFKNHFEVFSVIYIWMHPNRWRASTIFPRTDWISSPSISWYLSLLLLPLGPFLFQGLPSRAGLFPYLRRCSCFPAVTPLWCPLPSPTSKCQLGLLILNTHVHRCAPAWVLWINGKLQRQESLVLAQLCLLFVLGLYQPGQNRKWKPL